MQLRHVLVRLSMCQEIFALKSPILAGDRITSAQNAGLVVHLCFSLRKDLM
jgi:hypothetical protein